MLWDIFCKVIDNHGDIGVCWRLAAQLAGRGEDVRLWVDDPSALAWMAPRGAPRVEVIEWRPEEENCAGPGDVVVEAFGCELSGRFQAAIASRGQPPVWINLEYLTAEPFAQRSHGLPSPVLAGAARGLTKYFFYPGFTERTGGLLREERSGAGSAAPARRVSLFCYEPSCLPELLLELAAGPLATELLVTAGRTADAARAAIATLGSARPGWNASGNLSIQWLPLLAQTEFGGLLDSCDMNFVRGEDSLVRALWAGQAFVWHIYPQHDDAHHAKLHAFLDWLGAPLSLRQFHCAWNGMGGPLPPIDIDAWTNVARNARAKLLEQDDLVTRLLRFVRARGMKP